MFTAMAVRPVNLDFVNLIRWSQSDMDPGIIGRAIRVEASRRAVQQTLGDPGVVDLLITIGYYSCLSHALTALEVELPPGVTSSLPA